MSVTPFLMGILIDLRGEQYINADADIPVCLDFFTYSISVISVLAKVLERVTNDQLYAYL